MPRTLGPLARCLHRTGAVDSGQRSRCSACRARRSSTPHRKPHNPLISETHFQPIDFGIGRLFARVTDAVIVGDTDQGTIVLWNPAAERIFGYSEAEAVGASISMVVAERLRAQHEAGLARFRAYGQGRVVDGIRPVEVTARARDGREFPIELTLSRIEADGRYLLAIVRDISDRQAVRDARQLERQRQEFWAAAAHELRTPLTAVSAYLQLSERALRRGATEEATEEIGAARRRIGQMARLVGDLLEVGRVEGGRLALRSSRFDLRDTVRQAVGHLTTDAGPIRVSLGDDELPIDGDAERIQQILDNLIANAMKYGGGRPIDVDASMARGAAFVRVRDRGIGVPETDRDQLFMAFFRTSNTRASPGTGLGLFISRRIAEMHGGRLDLESTSADGSTFVLEVPLART